MGFAEILLPPMEKIEGLINFIPVREAIKQVMSSSTEPITYQDSALRDQFKSAFRISKTYDDAASNPVGYRINESKLGDEAKTNKRLFLSLFDYPPAGPRGFWMSSTPQPLCYKTIAAPLILFRKKITAYRRTN